MPLHQFKTKRFILLTKDASAEDQMAIVNQLRTHRGVAWWHHFPQCFLIVDKLGFIETRALRDEIMAVVSANLAFLVFEVTSGTDWAGGLTDQQGKWLNSAWTNPPDPKETAYGPYPSGE